jgi:hypothetical protein
MGKGPSTEEKNSMKILGDISKDQSALGKQLAAESAPWRQAAGAEYMTQIKDPSRAAAPAVNDLTRTTGNALNQIDEMQPGGAQDRARRDTMMGLRTGRAQLMNQNYGAAVNSLGNLGIGTTQQGIGAYGGAGSAAGGLGQVAGGVQSRKANAIGSGASGFGALLGGL